MTKAENRAVARAYAAEKNRKFREDQDRAQRESDWKHCGLFEIF